MAATFSEGIEDCAFTMLLRVELLNVMAARIMSASRWIGLVVLFIDLRLVSSKSNPITYGPLAAFALSSPADCEDCAGESTMKDAG